MPEPNNHSAKIIGPLVGGIGLCGLQLYHIVNYGPSGWAIGGLIGCAIGTIITIVLAARR